MSKESRLKGAEVFWARTAGFAKAAGETEMGKNH